MTEALPLASLVCLFWGVFFIVVLGMTAAIRIVPEYHRMSVYRLGRYIGDKGPGIIFLFPFIERGIVINTSDDIAAEEAFQTMFGVIGETQSQVYNDGKVEIDGKTWSAVSSQPIPPGIRVRVSKVILEIERI